MDKRLELTSKQIKLVEEFQAVLDEMVEANVGFIADYDEDGYGLQGFKMYNKEKVSETGYGLDPDDYPDCELYIPLIEEFEDLPLPFYKVDQMDVDTELLDLPDLYNDYNKHLVVLLKD